MTLQQLKYFIEIVNCGSINKAAERLYIAQSSLSNALRDLETEMGLDLINRTPKGTSLTTDGAEFLGYARQVVEQTSLLEQRWLNKKPSRRLCSISTQHYAFAVNAFVNMVKKTDAEEYEYTLREARTFEIVDDVKNLRSELGILYMNDFNRKVIEKMLRENGLTFHLLSEEILSTEYSKKDIRVGDRASIFNLMIGLNGYTISTGIVSADLNGENIIAIPLLVDDAIEVGWISHNDIQLTQQAALYLEELKSVVAEYGVEIENKL